METDLVSSQQANVANVALNVFVCVGVIRKTKQVLMQQGKMEAAQRHEHIYEKHMHTQRMKVFSGCRKISGSVSVS